jgi:hypothetical protein
VAYDNEKLIKNRPVLYKEKVLFIDLYSAKIELKQRKDFSYE